MKNNVAILIILVISSLFIGCVETETPQVNDFANSNTQKQTEIPTSILTHTQTPTSTPTPTPAPTTVKKDLSKIALTLDDMPSGTTKRGDDVTDSSSIERKFLLSSDFGPVLLICKVNSYSTIQKAENEYNLKINEYSTKTESDIGDEGIEIVTSSGCTVVFRKANIIVEVDWLENYYFSFDHKAIQYAKIVENRI